MTSHPRDEDLHDLVDGLLTEPGRSSVEGHMADCTECRDRLARLKRLLVMAREAPRGVAPPDDWWPAIRGAIDERQAISLGSAPSWPSQPWWTRPWALAAAAMLLIAASATVTALVMRQGPRVPIAGVVNSGSPAPSVSPRLATMTANYESLTGQLLIDFDRRRAALPPEAVAQVEQNLRVIDMAISEIVTVLQAEPDNDVLLELLDTSYRQKVAVLEHATESVS
jgi:anti-sigma factor RsiW